MICWGKTADGKRIVLSDPLYVLLRHDEDAPADSLEVRFAGPCREMLCTVEAYSGGICLFSGIVDEQNETITEQGEWFELICRSKEAVLLDNAVAPQSLRNVSAAVLREKLLSPLGFSEILAPPDVLHGNFTLQSEESVYAALSRFCRQMWGTVPYVDRETDRVICTPQPGREIHLQHILQMQNLCDHTGRISAVGLPSTDSGRYEAFLYNPQAQADGIRRIRYRGSNSRTQPSLLIRQGEERAFTGKLVCAGMQFPERNDTVRADNVFGRVLKGCRVKSAVYRLDSAGERTELTVYGRPER